MSEGSAHRLVAVIARVMKYLLPVAVSAGMVVRLFHKVDIRRIGEIMSSGVDYRYLVAMMVLTVLSHVIRGIRWGIQLRAAGIPRIPVPAESVSIFGAYALNLLFPYLGGPEVCLHLPPRAMQTVNRCRHRYRRQGL